MKTMIKSTELLDTYRKMRAFNVERYCRDKVAAINKFFSTNKLDSVVFGISGGVDSAVVAMLFDLAAREPESPIKKTLGLIMPIVCNGTTGQLSAKERALDLCDVLMVAKKSESFTYSVCDLTHSFQAMVDAVRPYTANAWANGQMASVLRTPMLYYQAAILQQQGYRSLVSGTTNRDEGSYIGFFGKASDGMVDVQPIADIHKSEVYQVAEFLGVPNSIMEEKPRGDVWDNRNDEEMIGAPYWFLELMLLKRSSIGFVTDPVRNKMMSEWRDHDLTEDEQMWYDNIESLHRTNAHKYKVGAPAHFIDVMQRKVPGGW